ncbi:hypothetical protein CGGC5_v005902 [Colletotrichum fructicola Nara gc5]|uniref:Uncharacterized protein n=1 Tax=Colletotrichum fructicola (strain Nara gc5) TaxID=1213859 RepID=A0A7J6JBI3_COLFN|nr:hypothetical protein CGGC5_v005902 [Colletotrichum fructicola Nara gc5]
MVAWTSAQLGRPPRDSSTQHPEIKSHEGSSESTGLSLGPRLSAELLCMRRILQPDAWSEKDTDESQVSSP